MNYLVNVLDNNNAIERPKEEGEELPRVVL